MRFYKRSFCLVLAVLLVLAVGFAAVPDTQALVVDPVAWLYPLWLAYGQQAGVSISTIGGNEFTQQGFTSLFNQWQQWEVSSGNQVAAQSISSFVAGLEGFIDIGAAITTGDISSVLRLGSEIVGPLARFWNWVIVDKLGASSPDAVDIQTGTGNAFASASLKQLPYVSFAQDKATFDASIQSFKRTQSEGGNIVKICSSRNVPIKVGVFLNGSYYAIGAVSSSYFTSNDIKSIWFTSGSNRYYGGISASGVTPTFSNGLYYLSFNYELSSRVQQWYLPVCSSMADIISTSQQVPGDITISIPQGTDSLDFPDTRSDPEYVAPDINITVNVPYNQDLDTPEVLQEAYDKAMTNEFTTINNQYVTNNPPVEGTGEVGDMTEYLAPGLSEVFPFCIPFDVYKFLSALAADPVAPHFTATLAFPAVLGGNQTVDIDFDNTVFNQLASILRTLELLAFIVGLAFVTRSMFIRG